MGAVAPASTRELRLRSHRAVASSRAMPTPPGSTRVLCALSPTTTLSANFPSRPGLGAAGFMSPLDGWCLQGSLGNEVACGFPASAAQAACHVEGVACATGKV